MNTIYNHWQSYRAQVVPVDASELHVTECRRAFYAGAGAALALQVAVTERGISEQAGVAMIEGLHDEARRFAAEVRAGRA